MRVGRKKGEKKGRGGEGENEEGRDRERRKEADVRLLGAPILLKHNYLLLWENMALPDH